MPNYYRFEQQFFSYLSNLERNIKSSPVYLGTGSGAGATIIGNLPQTRISYDSNEFATNTTDDPATLLDNLNHIRYDIVTLQDAYLSGAGVPSGGGLTQGHLIYNEAVELTQREKLVLSGAGVTVVDNSSNDSTDITINPDFLDLPDTPPSYVAESGKVLRVNEFETGIEFADSPYAGNKIIHYNSDGTVADEYSVNEAGLRSALNNASSGDIILLPPQTITINTDGIAPGTNCLKVKEGVTLRGMSREFSIISANISTASSDTRYLVWMFNNSIIDNLTISYTRDNEDDVYGIMSDGDDDIGIGGIYNTTVIVNNLYNSTSSPGTGAINIFLKYDPDYIRTVIDNCLFVAIGGYAGNYITVEDSLVTVQDTLLIKNSVFTATDTIDAYSSGFSKALQIYNYYGSNRRTIIDNCRFYGYTSGTYTSELNEGLYARGIFDIKDCFSISESTGTADNIRNYGFRIETSTTDSLSRIINCIGIASNESSLVDNSSYCAAGLQTNHSTIINGYFKATNSLGDAWGIHVNTFLYATGTPSIYNTVLDGNKADIRLKSSSYGLNLYNCQYDTLSNPDSGTFTLLQGDRAGYEPESYHSSDIEDNTLTRHLPLPVTSGYIAVVFEDEWILSPISGAGSGTGTFLDLTDTPSDYTSQLGKALVVASGEDGIEFTDLGTGDMTKAVYDTNDNGIVDEADATPWTGVTGKPATYPPDSHNHSFLNLTDSPSSYNGESNKVIAVKDTEDGLEFVVQSGASFLDLPDTPSSYTGQAGRVPLVNDTETGLVLSGAGAGDMYKSTYDTDDDGIIDEIPWTNVTDKPTTFSPSTHNHDDRYYKETEIDIKLQDHDEFLDDDDTPSSYAGQAGKAVIVADTEDQLQFVSVAGIGSGIEYQVLTSLNDEDPDFLLNKFIAGSGIALTETLDEGDGSIIIDTTASGVGDMTKSVYDTNDDGVVDTAPWDGITDKPSTYPPDSHDHDDLYYTETEIDTKLALQDEFTELTDSPSSYSGESGKVVAVKDTEDGLEFVVQSGSGSGAGASTFIELTDVPSSYNGQAGKYTVVNETEDGLEFVTHSGAGAEVLVPVVLYDTTLSGAGTFDTVAIPDDVINIEASLTGRSDKAGVSSEPVEIIINNDTTEANYGYAYHFGGLNEGDDEGASNLVGHVPAAMATSNYISEVKVWIPHVQLTGKHAFHTDSSNIRKTTERYIVNYGGIWLTEAAITSIKFVLDVGPNFVAGSRLQVLGYKVLSIGASDLLDLNDTPVTYSGASGQSLVVNDEEDGVEFVTVSGERILIEELTPTGTTATFSSIPATYTHLELDWVVRSDRSGQLVDELYFYMNNDTTATNYRVVYLYSQESSGVGAINASKAILVKIPAANATAGCAGYGNVKISYYAKTTFKKRLMGQSTTRWDTSTDLRLELLGYEWESTSAISQIDIISVNGANFISGSTIRLYGVN